MPEWSIVQSDATEWLDSLDADSADLLVCSPPYEKARIYYEDGENLGIARNTEEWVYWMSHVVRAAMRVTRGLAVFVVEGQTRNYAYSATPILLMAELISDGFTLRKPPIYRRYGIPGSGGTDWLRNDYEFCVCVTRGGKLPWSDPTACGKPPQYSPGGLMSHRHQDGTRENSQHRSYPRNRRANGNREQREYNPPKLSNPGNVIDCGAVGGNNMGSNLAHENEAPYPEQLAEFFVRSFCPPGGLVIDPFSGSGTTGAVAIRNGRNFAGCDLRGSQVELTTKRLRGETPSLFEGVSD